MKLSFLHQVPRDPFHFPPGVSCRYQPWLPDTYYTTIYYSPWNNVPAGVRPKLLPFQWKCQNTFTPEYFPAACRLKHRPPFKYTTSSIWGGHVFSRLCLTPSLLLSATHVIVGKLKSIAFCRSCTKGCSLAVYVGVTTHANNTFLHKTCEVLRLR